MADFVFVLCGLTSLACSLLLYRAFHKSRARLLLWSSLCFLGLATSNFLLYLDIDIFTQVDLSVVRTLPALAGVCCLIYGLVFDSPT